MITVVIPYLKDPDLPSTVKNILETSDRQATVRVVGDGVSVPPTVPKCDIDYLAKRAGVGPARHMGILCSVTPWVLLTDAHVRLPRGWFQSVSRAISAPGNTVLYCGQCVAITDEQEDPEKSTQRYWGATLNVAGPDRQNPKKFQLMQAIWSAERPESGQCIPAVMGACYLVNREWYNRHFLISGLDRLLTWGGDEELLSISAWLSGGEVRFLPELLLGHKFNIGKPRPYAVPAWHPWYNRIMLMRTYLAPEMVKYIEEKMPKTSDIRIALKEANSSTSRGRLDCWRINEAKMLTRDFGWYMERFGLKLGI